MTIGTEKKCSVDNCKREYRAKGYCFFHYKKWRQGDLPHARYKTCHQETCKKKIHKAGLCADHYTALYGKKEVAAAPAPTPAATEAPAA
jgi:hypothetical protein